MDTVHYQVFIWIFFSARFVVMCFTCSYRSSQFSFCSTVTIIDQSLTVTHTLYNHSDLVLLLYVKPTFVVFLLYEGCCIGCTVRPNDNNQNKHYLAVSGGYCVLFRITAVDNLISPDFIVSCNTQIIYPAIVATFSRP